MDEVRALYERAGWLAYLRDDAALRAASERSLLCLGAFDEEDTLWGFARCVGDGEHIVLLQDLLVDAAQQHRGIGTALFRSLPERYSSVRMFQLNTDIKNEKARRFYAAFNMKPLEEGSMISRFR